MNTQNITPFSTGVSVSEDELIDLLAEDIADDLVERMFLQTAEEMDVLTESDLQSLSAGSTETGDGAHLIELIAQDVAERSIDTNFDKVIEARFAAPATEVSTLALQSLGQFGQLELQGFFAKLKKAARRVTDTLKRVAKEPLTRKLVDIGIKIAPKLISLLQAAVPQDVNPQGIFSRIGKAVSGVVRKGLKQVKKFAKDQAKDFVHSALRRVDEFITGKIKTLSIGVPSSTIAPDTDSTASGDGFFWEQNDQNPAPFAALIPMATPQASGRLVPMTI